VLTPIWTIFLLRVSCIRSAVKLTSCISPLYAGTGWETGLESGYTYTPLCIAIASY
jgi:hypothetical protein